MLQAINQAGEMQTLVSLNKDEVSQKRNQLFYCPVCKERLIVKAGDKMIAHFAHQSNSSCPYRKGGEGNYHEQGKLNLYYWLKGQGLDVELEKYLPDIQQRPDLLVKVGNKVIAIEYQCARLSQQDYVLRNKGYKFLNIIPIWILGGNRMKRLGQNHLSINSFDLLFIHQFSNHPLVMYFYCPESDQISIFQHIQLTGKKRTFGSIKFNDLSKISFIDLFKKSAVSNDDKYKSWEKEKSDLRMKHVLFLSKQDKEWRQWLYLKQLHVSLLSPIIYLPVDSQWLMYTPPWNWQSRLTIEILMRKQFFTLESCHHLLRKHVKPHDSFPLITNFPDPISEYLNLLVSLSYLKKITKTSYEVISKITHYKTLDQAMKADEHLMNTLIRNTSSSTHE